MKLGGISTEWPLWYPAGEDFVPLYQADEGDREWLQRLNTTLAQLQQVL